jgi:hypothetical protein
MTMRAESWLLAASLLLAAGCVQHRAVIEPAADEAPSTLVAVRAVADPLVEPFVRQDALPLELRASAFHRAPDGTVLRQELAVATPLPWWQRFPADLVSDLLIPRTFIVQRHARIQTLPVLPIDAAELLRLATEHGYGGRSDRASSLEKE